ncbi:MAG: hypothetical protein ABI970_11930, partial [Chloroflexota bacterium]
RIRRLGIGGGYDRASRCTGGISRTIRHTLVSFRRIEASFPPIMAAVKMSFVTFLPHKVFI